MATSPLPPLTHHEILALVAPFTARGRRVDLEASDRIGRRLAFRELPHAGQTPGGPGLLEELTLESPRSGVFRLTRLLIHEHGPRAELSAEGPEPGQLVERLDAVSPWSQFRSGPGYVLGLRHRWSSPRPSADLILLGGTVQVAGASLTMKTSQVRGYAAELTLAAEPDGSLELPDDLLAVLGWSWAPLRAVEKGWASRLRLRGREPDVSRLGEARLEETARHLATTLGETPARFHGRFLASRWGAMGRRAIPALTSLGLVGGLALLRFEAIEQTSVLRLVIFNAPLLLIGLSFTLQEYARIELPPWPRRPRASTWSRTAPAQPEGRPGVE